MQFFLGNADEFLLKNVNYNKNFKNIFCGIN